MAILDHYLNLVTSEHRDKKKFMATVEALLRHSDDIFEAGIYVDDEFDLDEAVGVQEDTLGEIVGMERTLPYVPHTTGSQVMDNESYRIMLKSKIAKNIWKGGIEDLEEIWNILFGTRIPIQDNQDMTVTVTIDSYDRLLREHIIHGLIIPKPQSVRIKLLANFPIEVNHCFGGTVCNHREFMISQQVQVSRTFNAPQNYAGVQATVREMVIRQEIR